MTWEHHAILTTSPTNGTERTLWRSVHAENASPPEWLQDLTLLAISRFDKRIHIWHLWNKLDCGRAFATAWLASSAYIKHICERARSRSCQSDGHDRERTAFCGILFYNIQIEFTEIAIRKNVKKYSSSITFLRNRAWQPRQTLLVRRISLCKSQKNKK